MPSIADQANVGDPVRDSVPKIDNAIAVGEDLDFQRKWWRFERVIWSLFVLILVADVLGAFGRGFLSKAEQRTSDGTLDVKYERIERASTPSILTINFGENAVHEGKIKLFISESLVKQLGTQRVVPAPETSVIGQGGITYIFPATQIPATVDLSLEPSFPGPQSFNIGIPGGETIHAGVFVMP